MCYAGYIPLYESLDKEKRYLYIAETRRAVFSSSVAVISFSESEREPAYNKGKR
jgi:hypothetical protein